MEETLMKLKEVHSSSVIILLFGSSIRIYDDDVRIIEFISNLISKKRVLVCNSKYLKNIEDLLKNKKINYVVLSKELDYSIYDYYYNENNKYNKYINLSKKYNSFRKCIIYFYNFIFNIPFNRYK